MTQVSLRHGHVALGANLQTATRTPIETLRHALELFERESLFVTGCSSWYQTPAFPAGSGPDFVNAVAAIRTDLTPQVCLERLHLLERELGRTRKNRWEARVCDLDLLDLGNEVWPNLEEQQNWQSLNLLDQVDKAPDTMILPHPRLQDRAFVLVPLAEVSPDWAHPVTGEPIGQMLTKLPPEDLDLIYKI